MIGLGDIRYTGYYAFTYTWSATEGEPTLTVSNMYEALDEVEGIYRGVMKELE